MPSDKESIFMPRYLLNISAAIAKCTVQSELSILKARKAGYLARHSNIDDAKAILRELRGLNQGYDPSLTGWILLSEGLISHFESLSNTVAKDRFHRSLTIAEVAGRSDLFSIAAAWLANSEFALGEIYASINHLASSLKSSTSSNDDARGRALLVLGDMLNWSGAPTLARHWYRESRKHAVHDGDIAMQNVMLFNTATYAVSHLTILDCNAPVDESAWRFVSLEVASAKNLNFALGIDNLPTMIPTLEAELKVVQCRWQESNTIFNQTLHRLNEEGQQRTVSRMHAQRAWCRANLGDNEGARGDISNALLHIADCSDLDDLFVLHSRLSSTLGKMGDIELEKKHRQLAAEYSRQFETQQAQTLKMLEPVLEILTKEAENPAKAGF